MIVFDLLVDEEGRSWVDRTLRERRSRLQAFAKKHFRRGGPIRLSPATTQIVVAKKWLSSAGGALDGVVAKRLNADYASGSGNQDGMRRIKLLRTADCVVGGFRYASDARVVGSLLLGLYNEQGLLDHMGFCWGLSTAARKGLTPKLEALIKPPGFTGTAPDGQSRWSTKRSEEWQPLAPKLVVEIPYDHFTGGRFRHGTRLLRFRPDKAAKAVQDGPGGPGEPNVASPPSVLINGSLLLRPMREPRTRCRDFQSGNGRAERFRCGTARGAGRCFNAREGAPQRLVDDFFQTDVLPAPYVLNKRRDVVIESNGSFSSIMR